MKTCALFTLGLFLLWHSSVYAFSFSGETEFGFTTQGEALASQYIFCDTEYINCTLRGFWVDGIIEQGEFALGPTFHLGDSVVKLWMGYTTEHAFMLGGTFEARLFNRPVYLIVDPKLATNTLPEGIYNKFFYQLNGTGTWQFRVESLVVGGEAVFVKIGPELRYSLAQNSHLYLHPFYDPIGRDAGFHIGFRFFGW